jgi:hypothetical protein
MPTTSVVPTVITYLTDRWRALSTLGTATPPVRVFLGPEVSGEFAPLALYVGLADPEGFVFGQSAGEMTGASSIQEWASMPAGPRNENLTIQCHIEAWSGDTDTRTAMLAAYGVLAAVENDLRSDVSLGGTFQFQLPGPTNHRLRWHQGGESAGPSSGAACRIGFDIQVFARLSS